MRENDNTKQYQTIGLVGRFKPLHYGGAAILEQAVNSAEYVKIGLGSANIGTDTHPLNMRNPFTVDQTADMIDLYLSSQGHSNYELVRVDDHFGAVDEQGRNKWAQEIFHKMGDLEAFVSGNDYVQNLLEEKYTIINAFDFIPNPPDIRASQVRYAAACADNWKEFTPPIVAQYLEKTGLMENMITQFGEEIRANPPNQKDNAMVEQANILAAKS